MEFSFFFFFCRTLFCLHRYSVQNTWALCTYSMIHCRTLSSTRRCSVYMCGYFWVTGFIVQNLTLYSQIPIVTVQVLEDVYFIKHCRTILCTHSYSVFTRGSSWIHLLQVCVPGIHMLLLLALPCRYLLVLAIGTHCGYSL